MSSFTRFWYCYESAFGFRFRNVKSQNDYLEHYVLIPVTGVILFITSKTNLLNKYIWQVFAAINANTQSQVYYSPKCFELEPPNDYEACHFRNVLKVLSHHFCHHSRLLTMMMIRSRLDGSSIPGLSHSRQRQTEGRLRQGLWLVLFVLGAILTSLQVYNVIHTFLQYPVKTRVSWKISTVFSDLS